MTTYSFSTLTNNQTIDFDPLHDVLLFDTNTRPAELLINGTASGVQFSVGGKSIVLANVALDDLGLRSGPAVQNVQFVSPGQLIVGEGTTAHNGNLANLITGLTGDDALLGLGGDDVLDGGAGADLMVGGLGNDLYKVDNVGDVVTEENNSVSGAGIDTVLATASYSLANYIENITLQGNGDINATGNTLVNTILGNSGDNVLDGKAGGDTLRGGDGSDTYFVDNLADRVFETNSSASQIDTVISTVSFTLGANFENLTLAGTTIAGMGNFRNNVIIGSGAANTINGGYGADSMAGGDGNDTYIVDNSGDQVTESSNSLAQIDTVASSVSYALGANLENLRLMGSGNIDGTGNALANVIYANAGNNTLDGQAGNDTASYASLSLQTLGDTTLTATTVTTSVSHAGVTVDLNIAGIQDTQGSGFDRLIGIENLTGSNYNDEFTGNAGNNVLDGGGGADLLIGGKGNDTYVVDGADTVVEANAGADGLDTVQSSVSYRLTANVEYLVLTATANSGIGNNLDNRITGNSAANFLDGRSGADKMDGGGGNDTFVIDNLGDEVSDTTGTDLVLSYINHTLGNSIENLHLMGTNSLNGTGNNLNNTIWANTGNNSIDAKGETLLAGVKGDTLSYEYGASSGITLDLAITGAQATGGSGTDTVVNVENLIGSNYDDLLAGNIGNNILDGLGGTDTLSYISATAEVSVDLSLQVALTSSQSDIVRNFENIVGGGFDDLMVGTLGTNVFDGGSAGSDTVSYRNVKIDEGGVAANLAQAGSQNTLASGFDTFIKIDNLEGSVNDDDLSGNAAANKLDGSAGADALAGQNGNDSLTGGSGNDTIDGGLGSDWAFFTGAQAATVDLTLTKAQNTGHGVDKLIAIENVGSGDGADNLTGNTGDNSLSAGFGVDTVTGGAGDDTLNGGGGADRLTGGTGLDVFVFDTELSADNVDRIVDFDTTGDLIHLDHEIFSAIALGALKSTDFQANATGTAKDGSDHILYETDTGNLYYDADGTGSTASVQFAVLTPGLALLATDFLVF